MPFLTTRPGRTKGPEAVSKTSGWGAAYLAWHDRRLGSGLEAAKTTGPVGENF